MYHSAVNFLLTCNVIKMDDLSFPIFFTKYSNTLWDNCARTVPQYYLPLKGFCWNPMPSNLEPQVVEIWSSTSGWASPGLLVTYISRSAC